MLVKDLTETAGIRTTFSSRAFADYVPEHDAAVVRRLQDAGFVVLGKSNTPEFGSTAVTESELNGACRNPWDPARTPGGSRGGAAAAVAAGVAAARARLRRRRLDPHTRLVLRALRAEALARPRLACAVRQRLARAVADAGPISRTVPTRRRCST